MATSGSLEQPKPISDTPWPKRTNKACCNCRRDKIRCDGERPCAACIRRGLSDDKCIDGCPPCRRSRARCDGGDPCGRCLEMGIDCADEPLSPSQNLDGAAHRPSAGPSRSVAVGRAKLACLACRRDNKKCDDSRPCSRCISRMEECIHVDRSPKIVKHRCVNCRKDNKKCEDNRPCRHCVDMNLECTDAPRKGSRGTRVKMACANCRRNKVQCGPERPCRVCVRRGLECTEPTCTCAENGLEPGNCAFCHSQRSKRNSQMLSDTLGSQTSEERQSDMSDTSSPKTYSFPGFNDIVDSQGPHPYESRPQGYRHRVTSQQPLDGFFPTNTSLAADAFERTPYLVNYSAQQELPYQQSRQPVLSEMTSSTNPFHYHASLNNQEAKQRRDMPTPFPQHLRYDDMREPALSDLSMPSSSAGGAGGLDRYLASNLSMDAPAHSSDYSAQTGFIPHYHRPSGSSYSQSGHSASTPANFADGVDVGIGTYASDERAGLGSLSERAYGPAPTALPVSMTVPVSQTMHSYQDASGSSTGQIGMHPQLRRSAYYLSSGSSAAENETRDERK